MDDEPDRFLTTVQTERARLRCEGRCLALFQPIEPTSVPLRRRNHFPARAIT